jgi:hypothetical protein
MVLGVKGNQVRVRPPNACVGPLFRTPRETNGALRCVRQKLVAILRLSTAWRGTAQLDNVSLQRRFDAQLEKNGKVFINIAGKSCELDQL